jgi:hypothetical protein
LFTRFIAEEEQSGVLLRAYVRAGSKTTLQARVLSILKPSSNEKSPRMPLDTR